MFGFGLLAVFEFEVCKLIMIELAIIIDIGFPKSSDRSGTSF